MMPDDPLDELAAIDWTSMTRSDSLAALYGWNGAGVFVTSEPADDAPGLVLVPRLSERLQAFGLTEQPRVCCGIGIGPAGEVREFIPMENVADDPTTQYAISEGGQLRVGERAAVEGWGVTLVFHTHVTTNPVPSVSDRALAIWPDAVYVILGLRGAPDLCAWRIRGGVDGDIARLPVSV